MMRISPRGLDLLKEWEELRLVAYQDIGGVWTIGYGSTSDVYEGLTISRHEADLRLREDVDEAETCVNTVVKVPLSQNQFDALVSFVFNIGCSAFRKSTLLKKLNAGLYDEVPAQMGRWNKDRVGGNLVVVPGLVNRRAKEVLLWNSDSPAKGTRTTPQPVGAKPVLKSKTMQGGIVGSAGLLGTAVTDTAQQLEPASEMFEWLKIICLVLTVIGLVLAIYGRYRVMVDEDV